MLVPILKEMGRAYGTRFRLVYDQRIKIRCYNIFEPMTLLLLLTLFLE